MLTYQTIPFQARPLAPALDSWGGGESRAAKASLRAPSPCSLLRGSSCPVIKIKRSGGGREREKKKVPSQVPDVSSLAVAAAAPHSWHS